jgi:hypothetical protein
MRLNDKDYETINTSVGAQTILSALGPMIDRQLDGLMAQFQFVEPELGKLLDHRAKILTLWRMKQNLRQGAAKGADITQAFQQMVADKMIEGA